MRLRRVMGLAGFSLCLAAAVVSHRLRTTVALPAGLTGRYFANEAWQGTPVAVRLDQDLEAFAVRAAWPGSQPEQFSVDWSGAILVLTPGAYAFTTRSDDGSFVLVDRQVVVDNGGVHPAREASGVVTLGGGWHELTIRYFNHLADAEFNVTWTPPGATPHGIPAWRLRPQFRSRHQLAQAVELDAVWSLAVVALALWILAIACAPLWTLVRPRVEEVLRLNSPWLPWVLAASAALNIAGVAWGLPARWAGDEILPEDAVEGVTKWFARDWLSVYPPVHFALLAVIDAPIRLIDRLGALVWFDWTVVALAVINRFVSVVMAAVVLIAVADVARRLFGRRAGLFAAIVLGLNIVFVYYARTSNVDIPYLFWFSLALVCYVHVLTEGGTAGYVWLGALAALAVATKEQAYGLFVLMPVPIAIAEWRRARARGVAAAWRQAVPRGAWLGLAVFAGTFAVGENLVAWPSFVAHVRWLAGPASHAYAVFPRTASGYAALAGQILTLVKRSYGWPALVAAAGGVAVAAARPPHRRALISLAVPAASYTLFFLFVLSYTYDRFALPICLLLAPFAGLAIDQALSRWRVGALAGVALLTAYGLAGVLTLDYVTWFDSRYAVRAWLEQQRRANDAIGIIQQPYILPAMRDFNPRAIDTRARLDPDAFDWVVVNADYARASASDAASMAALDQLRSGRSGYRRVLLARTSVPWAWIPDLSPDLVGPRDEPYSLSVLRNVNPTIEVFQRERRIVLPPTVDRTPTEPPAPRIPRTCP